MFLFLHRHTYNLTRSDTLGPSTTLFRCQPARQPPRPRRPERPMMRRRRTAATGTSREEKGVQNSAAAGPSTGGEEPVSGSGAANPAPDAGSTSGKGISGWGGLLTPDSVTVVLIDLQPSVALAVRSIDEGILVNNAAALAKTAKAFGVPLILSTKIGRASCRERVCQYV